ncbi:MAG: transrane protease [Actinomycetia bacterium]|jgi:membrane protease YdiL (CAAX protease family)|nr:transrane protease [Actinomycetes bacterium]
MNAPLPPPPDELLVEHAPPRATWRWWEALLAVLLAWLAGGLAVLPLVALVGPDPAGPIGPNGFLFATVSNTVTILVLVMWLRNMHPGWERIIGWPDRDEVIRELAVGAGLGIVVRLASAAVAGLVVVALRGASGRSVQLPEQVRTDLAGWGLVIFAVFAVIAAPALEEFVFRGLLFRSIADRRGFWVGALVSAAAFGAFHLLTPGDELDVLALGITHMGTGLGLAWIYWRRRNLLASIAGHSAFNLIAVVSIIGGWEF